MSKIAFSAVISHKYYGYKANIFFFNRNPQSNLRLHQPTFPLEPQYSQINPTRFKSSEGI